MELAAVRLVIESWFMPIITELVTRRCTAHLLALAVRIPTVDLARNRAGSLEFDFTFAHNYCSAIVAGLEHTVVVVVGRAIGSPSAD